MQGAIILAEIGCDGRNVLAFAAPLQRSKASQSSNARFVEVCEIERQFR